MIRGGYTDAQLALIQTIVWTTLIGLLALALVIVSTHVFRRVALQRIDFDGRELVTNVPGWKRLRRLAAEEIGTVVLFPDDVPFGPGDKTNFYACLLVLDRRGRRVRVIYHYPGTDLRLRPLYDVLPAGRKIELTSFSRRDLLRAAPGSITPLQMRSPMTWAIGITIFVAGVLPVVALIVFLLVDLLVILANHR